MKAHESNFLFTGPFWELNCHTLYTTYFTSELHLRTPLPTSKSKLLIRHYVLQHCTYLHTNYSVPVCGTVKCKALSRLNSAPYCTDAWQSTGVNLHIFFTFESDGEYAAMQLMHAKRAIFFDRIISSEHIIK
jgi:hypothetical protein